MSKRNETRYEKSEPIRICAKRDAVASARAAATDLVGCRSTPSIARRRPRRRRPPPPPPPHDDGGAAPSGGLSATVAVNATWSTLDLVGRRWTMGAAGRRRRHPLNVPLICCVASSHPPVHAHARTHTQIHTPTHTLSLSLSETVLNYRWIIIGAVTSRRGSPGRPGAGGLITRLIPYGQAKVDLRF